MKACQKLFAMAKLSSIKHVPKNRAQKISVEVTNFGGFFTVLKILKRLFASMSVRADSVHSEHMELNYITQ